MIKAIIFDFDDTLADTSARIIPAKKVMVRAMIDAGFPAKQKDLEWKKIYKLSGADSVKYILKQYNLKDKKILDAGLNAYYSYIGNIKLNPGAKSALNSLKGYKLILLTTGKPEIQKKKVELFGISNYFCDIVYDDVTDSDKELKIRKILKKHKLKTEEVISVGDKLSDVEASNKAGVTSVRCLTGRFKDNKPKNKFQMPDYKIKNLRELNGILK